MTPVVVATANTPAEIGSADLNSDHYADLAYAEDYGILVLVGNGDGTFQPSVSYGGPTLGVVLADLNLDAKPDIVTYKNTFLGKGDGTFGPALPNNFTLPGGLLGVGDIDGDGKPDLASTPSSTRQWRRDISERNCNCIGKQSLLRYGGRLRQGRKG